MFGKRILILVPHPDDEVVACAASIGRARAQGAALFALYLTNGCIAFDTMWPWDRKNCGSIIARRRAEGEEAARFLGLIPAGWAPRPARHLWREMGSAYAEVERAVLAHHIDQIWAPAYEGGNADHDAANAIASLWAQSRLRPSSAQRALGAQSSRADISVLEFAEYNYSGGRAKSQEFPERKGGEEVIMLTPDERERKRKALRIYESEQNNLGYVKAERECYRPLAAYDYGRPPHAGTLWYARFQWVPFRHPRVDFTKPADVSAAIRTFLKDHTV